jgi:hypothetical protein
MDGYNGAGFGVNDKNLFDEVAHTQGGMPHILQYLWDAYVRYLQAEISKRRESNKPTVTVEQAVTRAPAIKFVEWAANYLQEHRVVENFYVDANHGIRLSNNDTLVISPGTNIQGTMQDSGAINVTEGKSQQNMEGIFNPIKAVEIR